MKTFKKMKFVANNELFVELPDEFTSADVRKLKLLHNPHFKKPNSNAPIHKWKSTGLIEIDKSTFPHICRKTSKARSKQKKTASSYSTPENVDINIISSKSISHSIIEGVIEIGNARISGTFTVELINK